MEVLEVWRFGGFVTRSTTLHTQVPEAKAIFARVEEGGGRRRRQVKAAAADENCDMRCYDVVSSPLLERSLDDGAAQSLYHHSRAPIQ